jgi:hypothetical protein
MELVVKALRVNTLSKLPHADAVLFDGIVNDVFTGVKMSDIVYAEVEQAVRVMAVAYFFFWFLLERDDSMGGEVFHFCGTFFKKMSVSF